MMARNEMAAMSICVAFTVAVSVVVHQSEPRQIRVASPLVASVLPVEAALSLPPIGPASAGAAGRREAWVRQFARANTLDTQTVVNDATTNQLALLAPAEPGLGDYGPLALPPLVCDDGLAVADAGDAAQDLPPALAEAPGVPDAAAAMAPDSASPKVYEVTKGDTLSKIVRQQWGSNDARLAALLVEANPKVRERKGVILAGEELDIPDAAVVQRVLAGAAPRAALTAAPGGAPATTDAQWYTIQRNDTLASIAKRFLNDSRRWREILALNGALDPRKISPGMRIKLPPAMGFAHS